MHQTVNVSQFRDAFRDCGRGEQFTYEALGALFDYLEQLEDDIGEPIELDVIALCCEWSEYDSARDAADDYGWTFDDPDADEDAMNDEALEWLQDRTSVIEFAGGVLVQQF